MKDTREKAEHDFDVQVSALVQQLHHMAEEVRRRAEGSGIDRVACARGIQTSLLQRFALDRGPLQSLLDCAIRAEHPTARATPAELLDQAATGVAAIFDDTQAIREDPVMVAEAALRGAGVIR